MVEQRRLDQATPAWLAHEMLDTVRFTKADRLLDPCAGLGGILQAARERGAHSIEFMELNQARAAYLTDLGYDGQRIDLTGARSMASFTVLAMNPDFRDSKWLHMIHGASNLFRTCPTARAFVTLLPSEWMLQLSSVYGDDVTRRDSLLLWLKGCAGWQVRNVQPTNAFVWEGAVVPVSMLTVFKREGE